MRQPLIFFCSGNPKAQPRAKAVRRGNFAGVYNPKTADDWKMIVRNECKAKWDGVRWDGPLCVNLTFYFPRPKSHLRSNGELKPNAPRWHTSKFDRDNIDKAVLDALTNLGVWGDDQQVCDGRIRKFYTDGLVVKTPGCLIEIKEAGE